MSQSTDNLELQFLEWLSHRPRTYGEVMDAWRTSCPRLSIWENALLEGLIEIERTQPMNSAKVLLTQRGSEILASRNRPRITQA